MQTYIHTFASLLQPVLNLPIDEIEDQITLAPENVQWDLAFPCFKIAKEQGKNPMEFSGVIASVAKQSITADSVFSKIIQAWPYINAVINLEILSQEVLWKIEKEKTEYWQWLPTNQEILLEWRNINTHKAVHIWHIRNILVSESVARIAKFAGNKVDRVCYPWDIWAHVAKWLRYFLNFTDQTLPTEDFAKRGSQLYNLASVKVDENPDKYKAEIWELQKNLEDGDPDLQKLWQETRKLFLEALKWVLTELWSQNFNKRYFESEVEKPWIEIVQKMLSDWIAEISQWATVINLEKRDLGYFLLLKSTGASLYSTKDIALAYKKRSDFPDYNISLYVVGSEQEHHFQQLFKTLEIIGFDHNSLKHLSYWLIDLKSWKMSSREGNIVLYEDFRDQLLHQAHELMKDRKINEKEKQKAERKVAFASMKFRILLQDSEKRMTFDEEKAVSFEGETWPYLQYTVARINSILKKAIQLSSWTELSFWTKLRIFENKDSSFHSEWEMRKTSEWHNKPLLLHLSLFPEIIQKSAQTFKPNYIARYCLDLAQLFNSFYQSQKIIDENDLYATAKRIELLKAVKQVMLNWFDLLGIEEVNEM